MQFTKNVSYGQKCVTFTDSNNNTTSIDYEDVDAYNDLLHTDAKFAELTINVHELMISNGDYMQGFADLKNYLVSINKYEGAEGSWRADIA